jgi:hypothetical protein
MSYMSIIQVLVDFAGHSAHGVLINSENGAGTGLTLRN